MKKNLLKKSFFLFFIISLLLSANAMSYQYQETQNLVNFVENASKLVATKGEKAFSGFTKCTAKNCDKDTYLFVIDNNGNYLVNGNIEEKAMSEKNSNVSSFEKFKKYFTFESFGYKNQNSGWIHYLYQKTNSSIPVWKSTYTKKVKAPSGKEYVVASGNYNLKLEKEFVEDEVNKIWELIREKQQLAFPIIRNKASYFLSDENFVFIIDTDGNVIFNTGKPYIENNNIRDTKDSFGTPFINNLIKEALAKNTGWISYYYPKTDETNPYLKKIFFKTAELNNKKVIIAYSVIFNDSIVVTTNKQDTEIYEIKYLAKKISAILKAKGITKIGDILNELSVKKDVFIIDAKTGIMLFDTENPELETKSIENIKDLTGKPVWKNMNLTLELNNNQGWIHCTFGNNKNSITPKCKSKYISKITSPDGKTYILGITKTSGNIEKEFLEDSVQMAINLIKQKKGEAFKEIKNSQSIFIFKKVRIFVTDNNGFQILDSEYPNLEEKNIIKTKDASGEYIVKQYIEFALKNASTWIDYPFVIVPGTSPIKKSMFVKKVVVGEKTYIVGAEFSV